MSIHAEAGQPSTGDLLLHIDANGTLAELEAHVLAALEKATQRGVRAADRLEIAQRVPEEQRHSGAQR